MSISSHRAAEELADELRAFLAQRFQIAVRIRIVAGGLGHRLYQVKKPKNRHLVDVRRVNSIPPHQVVDQVMVVPPVDLIAQKVTSMVNRSGTAKRITDLADLHRLLLTFPALEAQDGLVANRLRDSGSPEPVLDAWREIAASEIVADDDDEGY